MEVNRRDQIYQDMGCESTSGSDGISWLDTHAQIVLTFAGQKEHILMIARHDVASLAVKTIPTSLQGMKQG